MAVRFRLDRGGVRELLKSRQMKNDMQRRAEQVADHARTLAPVVSGEYRRSIEATTELGPTRHVGRAIATVPYAQKVEADRRVLGRAIDAGRR